MYVLEKHEIHYCPTSQCCSSTLNEFIPCSTLGCLTKTCFWWRKLAQAALQVFGGCFEGIQKEFWFWQLLGVAIAILIFNNFWGFNFHPKTPNWAELWKVGIFSLLLTNVYSFNDKFNASMTNVTRKWELWQVNSEFACTSVIDWV